MKSFILFLFVQSFCAYSFCQDNEDSVKQQLIMLEKQSWEAWKNQDSSFFMQFLSEDHIEMGTYGPVTKQQVVHGVASRICNVASYKTDHYEVKILSAGIAVVTYRAEQQTKCMNTAVPSPVWVSSLYIKRNNKWENVLYQQTPAAD